MIRKTALKTTAETLRRRGLPIRTGISQDFTMIRLQHLNVV
jgi:hypothetical protein